MAEAIKKKYQVEPELIKSRGGVFEVVADGELIFSKKKEFRFPDSSEILEALRNR